ncbi:MAG: BREX system P-loop protein BrxC [Solidesulfovibrio sp.]|uniref:BREX system P-loop protein BrxC n=1 Tax=Solidesulfovibrio sp. TaxID=2910990 RepID=UPI00315884D9
MIEKTINSLFANDIARRIEEVIKVDQADEQIIRDELAEYVVTDSIRGHFTEIFDHYWETPKKPHEGVGIWVSGFFGSGKSSFAKYLGLALENRQILGHGAAQMLSKRTADQKVQVLLTNIAEQIPTEAVIFDVSTDRGIRTGNQSITEIMYRLFLQSLGYARDLDLSELEITLEDAGRLDTFKQKYREVFDKDWDVEKGKIAIAVQQASRVMHELDPATYPTADSWRESALRRADISAGDLAKRGMELMSRRRPGKTLLFVVDEVGQFVARDVQKMLDLQAVVQNLGRIGRGKLWLVVTSQEKLTELVGGLDEKRVELARLMDRFPLQVHLEPSDISEVTSKRVLSKNADAEAMLRALFKEHRGRLTDNTRLTADIKLPELSTEAFVDLYPLLPYQIDLIIQVVSGLRTQGGASKHVGGANRTIIKLAQQLLIHPDVDLQGKPVGTLARIDQVYDLVAGNISSEVRGKIDDIGKKVEHSLAQAVAKSTCLLQYVRSIHRTAENIAATLHPMIDADSMLVDVKAALAALEKAHMVRLGDDGYRIPTPAEDDWERQRSSLSPKPGDVSRLHAEVITGLWQPQPSHNFLEIKVFRTGLFLGGREVVEGDIPAHLTLAEAGKDYTESVEEARKRSQTEAKAIFWVMALDEAIDRETVELFRSKEILSRKERGAQTKDETALVAEEKLRQRRHQDELRRLIKQALLTGTIFFRGNDRSPEDGAADIARSAGKVLAQALPEVFDRFEEAAARVGKKDLESLMTTENLRGLGAVFSDLGLVRDQGGNLVFNVESGPLAEVLARIENRTSYGEVASGRYLADEFVKEPFGWDFDVIRLLVVALLRAGKVEATSKGQMVESALSLDAKNTFPNNNLFRQASFRPKVNETDMKDWADAAQAFEAAFGKAMPDISNAGVAASTIRSEVASREVGVEDALGLLRENSLPGMDVLRSALDHMRSIRAGKEDNAILTFNTAHKEIKEAVKRSAELAQALTTPRLHDLGRARKTLETLWPFLEEEPDLDPSLRGHAEKLRDLMAKETFFRELPAIDEHTRNLETEYKKRHDSAVKARVASYEQAIVRVKVTPGWEQLNAEQQNRVLAPLASRADPKNGAAQSIPLLRADVHACPGLLNQAIEEVLRYVDGTRVVRVTASSYFSGGIETEDQLDQALDGLKEQCLELIGAGKKILVQ